MSDGENFGERMTRLKAERGITTPGPGRPKIADKYRRQIVSAERVFANAMPDEAERYVEELEVKDPEFCSAHGSILRCIEPGCMTVSRRTAYNHKAAAYLFDRIMGKPTARTENTITVRLVEQMVIAFVAVFGEVNELADPFHRREAFAARLAEVGAQFSGSAA